MNDDDDWVEKELKRKNENEVGWQYETVLDRSMKNLNLNLKQVS